VNLVTLHLAEVDVFTLHYIALKLNHLGGLMLSIFWLNREQMNWLGSRFIQLQLSTEICIFCK
jgi:hypothetical protein